MPRSSMRTRRMLPMDLRVGDRFTDEEGDWEIVTHPVAYRDGKAFEATVRPVDHPGSDKGVTWPAHERVTIRRPPREAARG